MQASKFNSSLVSFAIFEANKAAAAINGAGVASKIELMRHAATMSDAAKIAADLEVVSALAGRFNLRSKASERPQFSGHTFDKTVPNGEAACKALQRARAILKPASIDEANAAAERLVSFKAGATDPVASLLAKFGKLTGPQKRSFLAKLNAR